MLTPTHLIARMKLDAPRGRIPERTLKRMLKVTNHLMVPGQSEIGTDLPLRENIFGLSLNGVDRAYPVSELIKRPVFTDRMAGKYIEIIYNAETCEMRAVLKESEEALVMQNHWGFGWKEFHPETSIWRAD